MRGTAPPQIPRCFAPRKDSSHFHLVPVLALGATRGKVDCWHWKLYSCHQQVAPASLRLPPKAIADIMSLLLTLTHVDP